MNIAGFGYALSDWTLCARLAGSPAPILIVQKNGDNSTGYFYAMLFPGTLPVQVGSFTPPTTHPSFPWGANVLPD